GYQRGLCSAIAETLQKAFPKVRERGREFRSSRYGKERRIMSDRNYRLRLGLFVLVALLLLGGLIALFGGAPSWFLKRNDYTIIFNDAPGISPGTPIRKSGVKVGEVGSITLDDATGEVHVQARLDPKFRPRTSEEPVIGRGLLAAETSIDFVPKEAAKPKAGEPIVPGSVMRGVSPVTARQLLAQAA